MPSAATPSTDNYYVGKGRVYFKKSGESEFRHLGNCSSMQLSAENTELDHFSSMEGVKSKDKSILLEKNATLTLTLEEWTADNLALFLLSSVTDGGSGGDKSISIFSENAIEGELKFEGANEIGPKQYVNLPSVSFKPAGSLDLISDEWGQIQLEADVFFVNGSAGTWNVEGAG